MRREFFLVWVLLLLKGSDAIQVVDIDWTGEGGNGGEQHTADDCSDPSVWCQPSSWPSGDKPLLFFSFENSADIGTTEGKRGRAISTDNELKQYLLLDSASSACITHPDNCTNGGSMAFWFMTNKGISVLTSCDPSPAACVNMFFEESDGTYSADIFIMFTDAYVWFWSELVFGWHHFTIVIPSNEKKVIAYHNGDKIQDTHSKSVSPVPQGSGKLVIGREYADIDGFYQNTVVDELAFWNRPLTGEEVKSIYNSYSSDDN